ncbi:MAG: carbon-nitrogen hydrolase family protein [Dehalococcoidales bacterium]|jgi:predicted amidohydrolase
MKLHLAQIHPELNDKRANLDKILGYIEQGLAAGANLIAFGECALNGYEITGTVDYEGLAEQIPGPTTEAIARRLKGKHCLVLLGMAERSRDDVYNAAPLIGPEGVIGVARKLYLVNFRAKSSGRIYAESIPFKAGERIAIFDTEFGRIGVQICLDNRHPEIAYAQAIAGCWLKLRPAAIPFRANQPTVNPLDLARGIENQTCDCTINLVGQQGESQYRGGTYAILGSRGLQKQASVGREAVEEVLEYEVTEEDVYAARGNWHNAREVRPDLLKQLWEIAANYQSGTGCR